MKINGKSVNAKRIIKLQLPRAEDEEQIQFSVCALPLGSEEVFEEMWPEPSVKYRTIQSNSREKPRREVIDDAGRQLEMQQRSVAATCYRFYMALSQDSNVQFDTNPVDKESLQALVKEINDSGFSAGDINLVTSAAVHASNLDDETWENIKNHFV